MNDTNEFVHEIQTAQLIEDDDDGVVELAEATLIPESEDEDYEVAHEPTIALEADNDADEKILDSAVKAFSNESQEESEYHAVFSEIDPNDPLDIAARTFLESLHLNISEPVKEKSAPILIPADNDDELYHEAEETISMDEYNKIDSDDDQEVFKLAASMMVTTDQEEVDDVEEVKEQTETPVDEDLQQEQDLMDMLNFAPPPSENDKEGDSTKDNEGEKLDDEDSEDDNDDEEEEEEDDDTIDTLKEIAERLQLKISEKILESTLEHVMLKVFNEKIKSDLTEIIEQAITKQISRIEANLLSEVE